MNFGAYDCEGRRKYLNKAEGLRFLASVKKLHDEERAFCQLIYYTGCRISEALALTKLDFDPDTAVIIFTTLKRRNRKHRRRIPIPEDLCKSIRSIASKSKEDQLWKISRTTAWRIIKRVMKEAQIEGIHATPKGLRHGFGVRAALNQIPLTQISIWMGHSDISTTSIYLDVRDEEERELIMKTW